VSTYLVGFYFGWSGLGLLSLWVSLEVLIIGSIPLLKGENLETSRGSMVYFLTQVLGGVIILIGCVVTGTRVRGGSFNMLGVFFLIRGCFIKMGSYPSFWWVSRCMGQLDWFGCFLVSCPGKAIPLYILGNLRRVLFVVDWVEMGAVLTTIRGVVLGIRVRDFRVLYGYSSIIHGSGMILVSLRSLKAMGVYLLFYTVICFGFVVTMEWYGVKKARDVFKFGENSKSSFLFIRGLYCFSLRGLPPFIGFLFKYLLVKRCFLLCPLRVSVVVIVGFFSMRFYYKLFTGLRSSAWVGHVNFSSLELKSMNFGLFMLCLGINLVPSFLFFRSLDLMGFIMS